MLNEKTSQETTPLTEQPAAFLSYRWNRIVDTLAKLFNAESCIITQSIDDGFLIRVAANTPNTALQAGQIVSSNEAMYCTRAILEKSQILINNSNDNTDTSNVSYCGSPLINLDGSIFGTLCFFNAVCDMPIDRIKIIMHDFSRMIEHDLDWSKHLDELSEHAYLDPLTQLQNRRGFFHLARQQIKWIIRHHKHVGLLFIDIDGLKAINDRFGHAKGDAAICALAKIIKKYLRPSDLSARYGGDEFIIFTVASERNELDRIMQRLQKKINQTRIDSRIQLNASVGAVFIKPTADFDLEQLISIADEKMYTQKHIRRSIA